MATFTPGRKAFAWTDAAIRAVGGRGAQGVGSENTAVKAPGRMCTVPFPICVFVGAYVIVYVVGPAGRLVTMPTPEVSVEVALVEGAPPMKEDEARRISRDLRDDLGQRVVALRYALSHTRQLFHRDPASIAGPLDELGRLVNATAEAARRASVNLRPRVLDELGLVAALEWLVPREYQVFTLIYQGRTATSARAAA